MTAEASRYLLESVIVLSGLAGILAALLVVAEAFIADYGDCIITINGQKELRVRGGDTLLNSLAANKIFVPSACGGRGTCAYCKVKVLEGGGPTLPVEEPYLTGKERQEGVRLSCQVKVRRNISIEIPEDLFNIRQYRARVERIRDLTYDIKEVRLALIEPGTIRFRAGQYIQLRTPPYGNVREPVYRAYSISSPSQETDAIELVIRLVPNGICTTWVFNYLEAGQEVLFSGPFGNFYLRDTAAEMIFVAGGSGFAPIKSILLSAPEAVDRRGGRFFFGARSVRDLFYLELMRDYASAHPRFEFIPALSEPHPDEPWHGETGLVTEVMARRLADASNKEFYLCGSPGMIQACVRLLRSMGASDEVIFFDSFA